MVVQLLILAIHEMQDLLLGMIPDVVEYFGFQALECRHSEVWVEFE